MALSDVDGLSIQDCLTVSRRAIEEDVPFNTILERRGINAATYDPGFDRRTLVFQHLPKTGGASLIQALETYFDHEQICSAYNPPDFDVIEDSGRFKLFRGHILGRQLHMLPSDSELFTIVRDPVGYAVSMYNFIRRLDDGAWDEMRKDGRTVASEQGDDTQLSSMLLQVIKLVRSNNLLNILRKNDNHDCQLVFWYPYIRSLMTLNIPIEKNLSNSENEDLVIKAFQSAKKQLSGAKVVGDFSNLMMALLVLCWRRGWPAPPTLPQIHKYDREALDETSNSELEDFMRAKWPLEFSLYQAGREIALDDARVIQEAFGEHREISRRLNEKYTENFFSNTNKNFGFYLTADQAWGGWGWGFRDSHGDAVCRKIADSVSATLLAYLEIRTPYILRIDFHSAMLEDAESLQTTANGTLLRRVGTRWTPRRTLEVNFDVPQKIVTKSLGKVNFGIHIPPASRDKEMIFSRVVCQPRHY